MAIMAKAGASYTPCPTGAHQSVCCDVVDLGIVKSTYAGKEKKQPKVLITWQTDQTRDDGRLFLVSKRYTNSLHEKAALRKDLESWRGRPFTEEEQAGFDLEGLIGVGAMINVIHNAANGNVYANVTAIMRLPKGIPVAKIDPSFLRMQDRPNDGQAAGELPSNDGWEPTDDDVPF
jgi:hypothetical protein